MLILLFMLLANFIWATLGWVGLSFLMQPNPSYWAVYGATFFLIQLPFTIRNYLKAGV